MAINKGNYILNIYIYIICVYNIRQVSGSKFHQGHALGHNVQEGYQRFAFYQKPINQQSLLCTHKLSEQGQQKQIILLKLVICLSVNKVTGIEDLECVYTGSTAAFDRLLRLAQRDAVVVYSVPTTATFLTSEFHPKVSHFVIVYIKLTAAIAKMTQSFKIQVYAQKRNQKFEIFKKLIGLMPYAHDDWTWITDTLDLVFLVGARLPKATKLPDSDFTQSTRSTSAGSYGRQKARCFTWQEARRQARASSRPIVINAIRVQKLRSSKSLIILNISIGGGYYFL